MDLFKKFYDLDYNGQQGFLRGLIRPARIARRRHGRYENPEDSHRQRTFKYMLPLRGDSEVQVWKNTFCKTFIITQRRVQIISEKVVNGVIDVSDRRGGSREKTVNGGQKLSNTFHDSPL